MRRPTSPAFRMSGGLYVGTAELPPPLWPSQRHPRRLAACLPLLFRGGHRPRELAVLHGAGDPGGRRQVCDLLQPPAERATQVRGELHGPQPWPSTKHCGASFHVPFLDCSAWLQWLCQPTRCLLPHIHPSAWAPPAPPLQAHRAHPAPRSLQHLGAVSQGGGEAGNAPRRPHPTLRG